jgi:hypothetical protein
MEINYNNSNNPWGRKGTLPYTPACTVKPRPDRTSSQMTKREEGEGEEGFFLARAGLSSYLCRLSIVCAHLSGIHPTTLGEELRAR